MNLLGKARHNLLLINASKDPDLHLEPWRYQDLDALSEERLIFSLKNLGIVMTRSEWVEKIQLMETPEDLFLSLLGSEGKDAEQIYLLIFSLWKKLIPTKITLSIFCDNLDHLISLYEKEREQYEEKIEETLADLLDILDTNLDAGGKPKNIFETVGGYLAYDLENFIYDYLADQIDGEKDLLASELIDGFYLYFKDPLWLDFLKIRLLSKSGGEESASYFARFLEELNKKGSVDLFCEVLFFLMQADGDEIFYPLLHQSLKRVKTKGDLLQIAYVVLEFYQLSDLEQKETLCWEEIQHLQNEDLNAPIRSNHPLYQQLLSTGS